MVETLDVNGSSALKTHGDPRPAPPPLRKRSLHPPEGFGISKPLGARGGGDEVSKGFL